MTETAARAGLGALIAAGLGLALATDLPARSGGQFWGDGATYYSMAQSLAWDFDLRYEYKDLLRVKREFAAGPQGLFLKRSGGGLRWDASAGFPWLSRVPDVEGQRWLYFAKPFVHPLLAAPLVRMFGTRGLLILNALALGLTLALVYAALRRAASPAAALAAACGLVLASAAPVYLFWPTPELVNMALVAAGLSAWSLERPRTSAVLLGIATYSKPYNLLIALPLGLAPFLDRDRPFAARLGESLRRGAWLAAVAAALFLANKAVTGEFNYQGGRERKTFYDKFPGDIEVRNGLPREVTFGNSGIWMTVQQLGPKVEGGEAAAEQGAEPPRSAAELRASFLRNLGYFWIGRFGGALAYFAGAVVAILALIGRGSRRSESWLAAAALAVSAVFYVVMIPDNWYGGSGTVGNRYFLNLLPLAAFLVPAGRAAWVAGGGALGLLFTLPLLLSPVQNSLHAGQHTLLPQFRRLPAELTMLNDLAILSQPWRKKQSVGDTEGNRAQHRAADPAAYYLYFLDDGTYGREEGPGGTGFWVRQGRQAEVVLRALEPVTRMRLRVTAGAAGDVIDFRGPPAQTLELPPAESGEFVWEPGAGFPYKDTFVYTLRLGSAGRGGPAEGRNLGTFVEVALEVRKR